MFAANNFAINQHVFLFAYKERFRVQNPYITIDESKIDRSTVAPCHIILKRF